MYIAHINKFTNEIQTVKEHCEETADLCKSFSIPELKDIMYSIGILHDIGKYQNSFQKRINGNKIKVEHSMCGAIAANEKYGLSALTFIIMYCIAGHHSGIPNGGSYKCDTDDMSTLGGRLKRTFEDYSIYKNELNIPEINIEKFLNFLKSDCDKLEQLIDKFAFFTRYCFSCLVDADSINTAEFCNGVKHKSLNSDFEGCLKKLNILINSFVCTTKLQKARSQLQKQVFENINSNADIFIMNMPTGSGKTLCSMKFALEKAINEKKKRIIYIIPYNSIIDQTADVFKDAFRELANILRHQSTFSIEDNYEDEEYKIILSSATENWNADIIITTAVQFFESVYSNKRSRLRKLHNMAESILIFDEVHTMPVQYLQPCLESVAFITKYLNSKAVFLTATMPNFEELINKYVMGSVKIKNLITDYSLFPVFQKCTYRNIYYVTKEELIKRAKKYSSSLIIVNKRRAVRELYNICKGKKYHLSTYMTSIDRSRVIKEIKEEILKLEREFGNGEVPDDRKITVISTSLIEAGVDMDFEVVFRERSGLDHILQAGGRCNREGKREKADVFIFDFEEEKTNPKKDIGAEIMGELFNLYDDISSEECIKEYFKRFYFFENKKIDKNSMYQYESHIDALPFKDYADSFNLIESQNISVVNVCDSESAAMVEEIKEKGVGDIRRLQNYTFSVYNYELETLIKQHVVDNYGTGIWCLTNSDYYDNEIGVIFEAKDYFID